MKREDISGLVELIGTEVMHLCVVEYGHLGYSSICITTSSGVSYEFAAREIQRARYEAYDLSFRKVNAPNDGRHIPFKQSIESISLLQRDEWITVESEVPEGILGMHPYLQEWGAVGSAPSDAEDVCTVTCGIILRSSSQSTLIFVDSNPELVGITSEQSQIDAFVNYATETPLDESAT